MSYPPNSPLGITLSASPLSPHLSVTRVAPYSFSSSNGVLQGDLVLSCNGKEVTNLQLLMVEVNGRKGTGNGVVIKFERVEKEVEEFRYSEMSTPKSEPARAQATTPQQVRWAP